MIFPEVKIYEPKSFKDHRGELWTLWNKQELDLSFNHDKVALSHQNVLRGLHGDSRAYKLITCLYGEIFFVVVDNRIDSPNYLKYDSLILNAENKISVLVPPMFANGHLVLSKEAVFYYKWAYEGEYPDVQEQFSLNWKDERLNIQWPIDNPILSERDK